MAAERFDEADENAAEHGARDVADAAEDRRGEGAQARGVADDEAGVVVIEAEDEPGRAGQRRAEEESGDDDAVDVDAHHARRLLVLRRRLHRLAHLGAAHEKVQAQHQGKRHAPDQHLAQAQHDIADLPAHGGQGIGIVF